MLQEVDTFLILGQKLDIALEEDPKCSDDNQSLGSRMYCPFWDFEKGGVNSNSFRILGLFTYKD